MSAALRTRLHAVADALADAVEAELAERPEGDALLSLPAVGAILHLHAATIRRRHREGRLGFALVDVDGVLRARRSDVEAWVRGLRERRVLRVDPVRRPVRLGLLRRGA